MTESAPPLSGRFRVHPVDLLVLVLAAALGALAWAYLFRTSPVPRPVDPYLGKEIELEFAADRDWKREFPAVGESVHLEEYLMASVLGREVVEENGRTLVRVRLRIHDRETQKPEVMTLFRTGVRRGTRLRMSTHQSEVEAEVLTALRFEEGE